MNLRRVLSLLGISAVIAMGGVTACTHEPAPTPGTSKPPLTATEKNVRTDVTHKGESVAPHREGRNDAVPCGFGPAGGLPC